jgi:hypothetical protein
LSNCEFREMAIEAALESGDGKRALALCLDGEELDSELSGLVEKWKKCRYRACGLLGDTQGQKQIAIDFAKDGDHFYFAELRRLSSDEEWPQTLEAFLDQYGSKLRQSALERILVEERLAARLMAFCQKHPERLAALHKLLLPEFEEETCAIFESQIKVEALKATTRAQYASVCALVEDFAKAFGKQSGERVLRGLMSAYNKRPAFKEELRKLSISKS